MNITVILEITGSRRALRRFRNQVSHWTPTAFADPAPAAGTARTIPLAARLEYELVSHYPDLDALAAAWTRISRFYPELTWLFTCVLPEEPRELTAQERLEAAIAAEEDPDERDPYINPWDRLPPLRTATCHNGEWTWLAANPHSLEWLVHHLLDTQGEEWAGLPDNTADPERDLGPLAAPRIESGQGPDGAARLHFTDLDHLVEANEPRKHVSPGLPAWADRDEDPVPDGEQEILTAPLGPDPDAEPMAYDVGTETRRATAKGSSQDDLPDELPF